MIRYPGSKDKIVRAIQKRFPDSLRIGGVFTAHYQEYREPFFGAGAVGLRVLQKLRPDHKVWLNDRDWGICCMWNAVLADPDLLIEKVRSFTATTDAFQFFKSDDGNTSIDPVEAGFRKIALHQTSFSGLGARAGGPIGGRKQSSKYNVDCRWNSARLCRDIRRYHALLKSLRTKITGRDFSELIADAPAHAFIYVDPPYVEKGPQLYKHFMTEADHRRLAGLLRHCRASWVLSYDDHPLVRALYSEWARIESVELTYTTAISSGARRKNQEVIISPLSGERREVA